MKAIKKSFNIIKKLVLKYLNYEIIILRHEYFFLNDKVTKLAKIIKTINIKLGNKIKNKVITARKLFNRDIMLIKNLAKEKNILLKRQIKSGVSFSSNEDNKKCPHKMKAQKNQNSKRQ